MRKLKIMAGIAVHEAEEQLLGSECAQLKRSGYVFWVISMDNFGL